MFKPGTDENDVRMSDVLCDFCHREWTDEMPFIEGHRGRMICGNCLATSYTDVVLGGAGEDAGEYTCTLCRESGPDREALDRAGEPGWRSPAHPDAVACRRCIKRAAGALHNDPDFDWKKPVRAVKM